MRNKTGLIGAVLCVLLSLPTVASAQTSSINTFSPYSFYGLGDFATPGTTSMRSAGGAGVAFREGTSINLLNPASMSMVRPKSALFNVGFEGKNYYLKTSNKKSSYNGFNINNVAFAIPVAKKLGVGVSVSSFSSAGYRIEDIVTQLPIGQVNYYYAGEGDVTQARLSVGYEIFRNFALGAEMMYYFGSLQRISTATLTPLDGNVDYKSAHISINEDVSKITANLGVQYAYELPDGKSALSFGATFQPKVKLNPEITKSVPTSDGAADFGDYIVFSQSTRDMALPNIISGGVYYYNTKISAGADYVFQGWKGSNTRSENDGVKFRNTNTIKAGVQYTPDRGDIRYFLNRVTYRIGARYSDYYMQIKGENISEKVVTMGVGIPITRNDYGLSSIDVGLEFGQRGTTRSGLVKENYLGFSIGLSLFGDDVWFVKPKYD